jgi:para-aminobenzoate synthetase component 1
LKRKELLISQPIKGGTAKRFSDAEEDEKAKAQLASDPKERQKTLLITDLVRNDLSHTAQKALLK